VQRGPQRRTGALDRAQRLRGRGQQVAEGGWQGRRYASREAAGEAQFQFHVGGADSRAGGSGAGLRARIAGLVEGQVRCKPIGAAARVRAGQEHWRYSTTVPWGVRCAVLQVDVHVRLRYGTATLRVCARQWVRLVTQRAAAAAAAGQRASDNDGEREERHGAAEAEGGVGWRGLVDSDGAPLLKATSTMEGVGAVGLTSTRNPWTAPRPPRA
jgi:hypothetical protein